MIILVIELKEIFLNEPGSPMVCRFGISIHQSFNIKLERVTERGYSKLHPSEVIDVRLGRSKNQFIHINITFHLQ